MAAVSDVLSSSCLKGHDAPARQPISVSVSVNQAPFSQLANPIAPDPRCIILLLTFLSLIELALGRPLLRLRGV